MLLALAISHADIEQAERLVKWIGFLSEQDGGKMADEAILVVWSVKSSFLRPTDRIDKSLAKTFGTVIDLVSEEHEVGWPGAANRMFQTALEFAEKGNDSVFFLEPDGVPLCPEWFSRIQLHYDEVSKKPFMGGYVPTPPPHMTGIAVYPPNWRQYAPSLVNVPDSSGWDTYCANEVNPHAHFTPLIQHVFRRHEPGWSVSGLNALDPRAVIFHQDKYGKLIRLLDQANYGGACARHPVFGYETTTSEIQSMTKFYYVVNATKAVFARGKRFVFDPVDAFAGSMPGVYATENPNDQELLSDLVQNPTTGVTEITQVEWEKHAKKNWIHPVLATSKHSVTTSQPQVSLLATPSKKEAVVVAEPLSVGSDPSAPPGLSQIKDINDVLKIDTVTPSQPAPVSHRAKSKRTAKKD